jgi:hypothetical protein
LIVSIEALSMGKIATWKQQIFQRTERTLGGALEEVQEYEHLFVDTYFGTFWSKISFPIASLLVHM